MLPKFNNKKILPQKILLDSAPKKRKIEWFDDHFIYSYQGEKYILYFDKPKLDLIKKIDWRLDRQHLYFYGFDDKKVVWLHRLVYGEIEPGFEIDHKDKKTFNCRLENLEVVTPEENRIRKAKC